MWEMLGLKAPGLLLGIVRTILGRPRPDVRILSLTPSGGSHDSITFTVELANYGTQQCRCELTATVGADRVECRPPVIDMQPSDGVHTSSVLVPRSRLGELMRECNLAPTLYDETLAFVARAGKHHVETQWREERYDPVTDADRHAVQDRYRRRARGEATVADARAEFVQRHLERIEGQRRSWHGQT